MITKLATFSGVSSAGEPLVRLFEPTAVMIKEAKAYHPSIQEWLTTYKPKDGKIAVLVNALGASEYWGQNSNGDYWPERALIHDCRNHNGLQGGEHAFDEFTGKTIPPYGYWTFLQAFPFVHHRNKDPNRAFGHVAVAAWNPRMRRVELVVILDQALALQHGAQHVVDRILAGEFPDVSMGARVPYDVCTICFNKSKTKKDYCPCVKEFGLGKVLDDGRMVGVINLHPRFFDISFVFIGADKTAKVMCKLASGFHVPQSVADAEEIYGETDGLMKAAGIADEEIVPNTVKEHKLAPSPNTDPTSDADTRLFMSRPDNQESPTGSAISDGELMTNLRTSDEDSVSKNTKTLDKTVIAQPDFLDRLLNAMDVEEPQNKIAEVHNHGKIEVAAVFARARHIKISAPPNPNRKKYPFVGTIEFRGLTIHVEQKPGQYREGVDKNGKPWRNLMHLPYGEIDGTLGTDKDKLDVFVGPYRSAPNVYIVHQNFVGGPKDGTFDEDKVMLGFENDEQAKAAYLAHYNSPKYFRSITCMAFPLFKKALQTREVHGEKVASVWEDDVAKIVMEDSFRATTKPAEEPAKEKQAGELWEYFSNANNARRREREWKQYATGKETKVTGSGLGSFEKVKEASAKDPLVLKVAEILHNGWSATDLLKVSNETKSAHLKWADIVKLIGPSKAVGRAVPLLSADEPDLPPNTLNAMGQRPDLNTALATATKLGMVLKPQEFQRVILTHLGHERLANYLDKEAMVFAPSVKSIAPCEKLASADYDADLAESLFPYIQSKSYLGPVLQLRLARVSEKTASKKVTLKEVDSPLLSKVASAYTWYRKEIMSVANQIPATVVNNPELHSAVFGLSTEDLFSKQASSLPIKYMGDTARTLPLNDKSMAVILGAIPLALMYSAHKKQQMEAGQDTGLLGALMAEHPWLTSMGVVAGLGALLRNPHAQQLVDEIFAAGSRIWKGKQLPVKGAV